MPLLVDTDAFTKLALAGLLGESAACVGCELSDCRRLPALVNMLRRGGLRRRLGPDSCDSLVPVAEGIGTIGVVRSEWLDRLVGIHNIDAGEAKLVAAAIDGDGLLLTGDKRFVVAASKVDGLPAALKNRVVTLEVVLTLLCDRLDPEDLKAAVAPVLPHDSMMRVCFSSTNSDPKAALDSYLGALRSQINPDMLWPPPDA